MMPRTGGTPASTTPSSATPPATDSAHCCTLNVRAPGTKPPIRLSQISAYTSPITTACRDTTASSRKIALYATPATRAPTPNPTAIAAVVPDMTAPATNVGTVAKITVQAAATTHFVR